MNRYRQWKSRTPFGRLRLMFIGLIAILTLFALPLVIVWKQAYIAGASMRIEAMTDTISAMNRSIARLEVVCGRMSRNERIEAFARSVLNLEYPASDRITIIPDDDSVKNPKSAGSVAQMLAAAEAMSRDRQAPREAGE